MNVLGTAAVVIFLIAAEGVSAGPPKSEDNSAAPVWTFRVTPVGESVPALRWRLLPELREQRPGDAAATYLRAMSPDMFSPLLREDLSEAMTASYDWALADFRSDKAKKLREVESLSSLAEADRAARCDACNWNLNDRQREDGVGVLLPELQSMRTLSRALSIRTRFALADGKYAAAIKSLQTQFASARHVGGDSCNLIQALVGIALTQVALRNAAEWIESPDSPNLYWALSALPNPYIGMRRGMEGERTFSDVLFPGYRDALYAKTPPPPIDMPKAIKRFQEIWTKPDALSASLLVAAQAAKAREYLIAHGWAPETVKSLPVTEAVVLYEIGVYDEFLDAGLKWMSEPPSIALPAPVQAESAFQKQVAKSDKGFLAKLLLPATQSAYFAQVRLDRQIAGLRCVEAIRMHAAATGKLPATSAEIKVVPWPTDPVSDKPFELKASEDSVTVVAAPPGGRTHGHSGFQFVVSLAKR